jgi:hypothetical protein
VCVSVPPRHGKSDTLLHYVAWLLLRQPTARILYVTHTAPFARKQSRDARKLARLAGVRIAIDGSNRQDEWETEEGGGLVARGIGGEITGRGFDIIIVDDPVKSRAVAESKVRRDQLFEWFGSDLITRLTPQGSVLVVHTRWHVDDLIGRLVDEKDFDRVNIRAVAENDNNGEPEDARRDGEALWPEGGWTLDVLEERREIVGEYAWFSLYQGEPRPRGGNVFNEPAFYEELPRVGYKVSLGADLAYTAKSQGRGDYSVIIELWRSGDFFYVVNVIRKQVEAPAFALTLRSETARLKCRVRWDWAGPEKGSAQFFQRAKIPLDLHPAKGDPFQRVQEVAAAWNVGKVLVPSTEHFPDAEVWLDALLEELGDFTGLNDKHDDQAVALASAFAQLQIAADAYSQNRKKRAGLPKPRE